MHFQNLCHVYSIYKIAKYHTARDDADFFRFPQPKTLLFKNSNIGLYSQLVSTRRPANTNTIYDGVPSYLNPNLMRQRLIRSTSVKKEKHENKNNLALLTRSQSERVEDTISPFGQNHENEDKKLADYPLSDMNKHRSSISEDNKIKKEYLPRHTQSIPPYKRQEVSNLRRSFSYQELDDTDTQWGLYNDEPGLHGQKLTDEHLSYTSYVKTAPQKR